MSTVTGLTSAAAMNAQLIARMQRQLDDLSLQLSTGKKSQSYAGLGIGRGFDVNLRGSLSRLNSYLDSITTVSTRVQLQNTSLDRLSTVSRDVRNATLEPIDYTLVAGGQTGAQIQAKADLDEAVSLLNQKAGNTFLFSGSAADTPALDTADHILNGNGSAAGLKQIISERLQADQGPDGRGRLNPPSAAGSVVTLGEDGVATHPFGFKLAGATTDIAGATVGGPSGTPPSLTIDLGGANPPDGATVQVRLNLPDGSSTSITLTASSQVPLPADSFAIGANSTVTAANLASVLDSKIQGLAKTELAAASAMEAANNFFDTDASNPAQRVAGPPFDTATALQDATATDTVKWYTGDDATDDPRNTMTARVDDSITVHYGIRANEEALRNSVKSFAVFGAVTFSGSDPDAKDRYVALGRRITTQLSSSPTKQQISSIQTEISGANSAAGAAKSRINDKKPILQGVMDDIENADPNEVGVKLLALSTQLQASLQTTSLLSKLSLVNFM